MFLNMSKCFIQKLSNCKNLNWRKNFIKIIQNIVFEKVFNWVLFYNGKIILYLLFKRGLCNIRKNNVIVCI